MKPKIFLPILLSFLILNSSFLIGTVRYVSPTGSSTPPYTSWTTAADSIMECINISVFGDTIYVANGTYKEQVVMIPGLSLIGAGMDSCVIDTRELAVSGFNSVTVKDSCLIKGFQVIVAYQNVGYGIQGEGLNGLVIENKILDGITGINLFHSDITVEDNICLNNRIGISLNYSSSLIKGNLINTDYSNDNGIDISDLIRTATPIISSNYIVTNDDGIKIIFGTSTTTIFNNVIVLKDDFARAYGGSLSDTVKIFNNLVIAERDLPNALGISLSNVPTICVQNYIFGQIGTGIIGGREDFLMNNVVEGGYIGYYLGDTFQFTNNNAWQNINNYSPDDQDSTNLSVDPMVVNDDSTKGDLDFHLQMFSPLIDAGDPNILDVDGTRSDIGLYGGPYGEQYHYVDLAPRTPVNLNATLDSLTVGITWNKNTEADFNHYNVYRDTTKNFTIDSTNLFLSTPVANLIDILPDYLTKIYYKLTAVDNQGNESEPSEEVGFILTSTTDHQLLTTDYRLYQNYPNPFNPSTKISYRLKERGYVKLYVYDIKGELVSVLVNQIQEAGYYEVDFNVKGQTSNVKSDLASGIYIYQIMVRSENDIPVFTDMKKMIYLK